MFVNTDNTWVSTLLAAKRRLYERYRAVFSGMHGARIVAEPAGCRSNYWLQAVLLDAAAAPQRDAILSATNDADLMTRPVCSLMHRLPPYGDSPRMDLSVAESLDRRLINLPSSAQLALDTWNG